MSLASIKNLNAGGLNSDINPVDLGEGFLTYCNNVRMKSGGIIPSGGYADVATIEQGVTPHHMRFVKGVDADKWIVACDKKILSYTSLFTDISPTAMPKITDGDSWTITSISGITIVNHPVLGPHYMDSATSKLIPLVWKSGQSWNDAHQKCDIIAVHRQFMFAMGLTMNGKYVGDGVRWSAPADVGAIPPNWDHLDVTSSAGIVSLGGSGGKIIGGLTMRDSFAVYREFGITMFDFVGGQYVWRARALESNAGLIAKDAVVDVNGIHYFMSYGDVFMNDGNTVRSIAVDRILRRLNSIDKHNYNRAFATHNSAAKEIWFCFPTSNYDYANTSFVYNYEYDSWMVRDLPIVISADNGTLTSPYTIWDNARETWDRSTNSWGDNANSPFDIVQLGLSKISATEFKIVALDILAGFNSSPYSSIIERTDLALGGIDTTNTITRVYPHVTGASKVRIQVGSQMMPGGPVLWKPYVDFEPNRDRKVDVRTTGLLHAYRIIAANVTSNFILTGLDFEYTEAGKR